jgi:hypothetical protein
MNIRAAFAAILLASTVPAEEIPQGLYIGMKMDDGRYSIFANLGIEQYENGKKTSSRVQNWYLECWSRDPLAGKQGCSLERTVYDLFWTKSNFDIGAGVSFSQHSTEDGNLKIKTLDWSSGKLDFTVVYNDGGTTDVKVRFKETGKMLHMTSFQALSIAHGVLSDSMSAVEYKVPQYTQTINVPVKLFGMKDEAQKRREDLEATLRGDDLKRWRTGIPTCVNVPEIALKRIQEKIPDINSNDKKLTAENKSILNA